LPPEKNYQQKANVYGRQEDDDNAHKLLTDKQANTALRRMLRKKA
jgi:hypothetical protein